MYGFHAFRHSAGTILYEVTRDTKLVQRALRHARLQTTVDYYVHPTDVIAREATGILIREILPDCDLSCDPGREKGKLNALSKASACDEKFNKLLN